MAKERFYSNYASKDDAEEAIKRLQSEGLNARIGPMQPIIDPKTRKNSEIQGKGYVGVYIIQETSKDFKNRIAANIPPTQSSPEDESLIEKLKKLEEIVSRVTKYSKSPAMALAPDEAINSIMEQQKSAFDNFVNKLKTSSQQELRQILKKIWSSEDLDDTIKVKLFLEVFKSLEKFWDLSEIKEQ